MKRSKLKYIIKELMLQSLNEDCNNLQEADEKHEYEQGVKWAQIHRSKGIGVDGLDILLNQFPNLTSTFKKGYRAGHGVSRWSTFNDKATDFLSRLGSGNRFRL